MTLAWLRVVLCTSLGIVVGLGYRQNSTKLRGQRHSRAAEYPRHTEDVAAVLVDEDLSPTVLELLRLAAVTPSKTSRTGCSCTLESWGDYAACRGSVVSAKSAWSFGIGGEDSWGEYLQQHHQIVPHTFDCYNKTLPAFKNTFTDACLSSNPGWRGKHRFTTLRQLFHGLEPASALVKMDIDGQEFEVLEDLAAEDAAKISNLQVNYHFNTTGCPSQAQLQEAKRVFQKLAQGFSVVKSSATYFGEPCLIEGAAFPKSLQVSYASYDACYTNGSSVALKARVPEFSPCKTAHLRPRSSKNLELESRNRAMETLCEDDRKDLMEAWLDPRFKQNFERIYDESSWVDEAFVNFFAAPNSTSPFAQETELLIDSVHRFSEKPIVVVDFTASSTLERLPEWTPERYPRLVLLHAKPIHSDVRFSFNKIRAMLLANVRTGVVLDSDQFVFRGVDRLFSRTKQEVTALYPYPIMPVHWMSRDVTDKEYSDYNFVCPECPKRTMRWGHAHPTWTFHALPFLGDMMGGQLDKPKHVFKTHVSVFEDEDALNVGLWTVGATKQWCKFDVPFPSLFLDYARGDSKDLQGCCKYQDAKWFPDGLPLMFYTAHAAKNVTESHKVIDVLEALGPSPPSPIYYNGAFYNSDVKLHFAKGDSCLT